MHRSNKMASKNWLKTQNGRIWSVVTMFFLAVLYSTIAAIFICLSILMVNKSFDSFDYKGCMWLIWFVIVAGCISGCFMSLHYIYIFYQPEYKCSKMTTPFLVLITLTELIVFLCSVCMVYLTFNLDTVMKYLIDQIDIDMIVRNNANEVIQNLKKVFEFNSDLSLLFSNSLTKLPDITTFLKPYIIVIFPAVIVAFKFISVFITVALNFLCIVSILLVYFQQNFNAGILLI